jgi:hypothetical protein
VSNRGELPFRIFLGVFSHSVDVCEHIVSSSASPADSVLTAKYILELANQAHFLYPTRNHAERAQLLKRVLLNCDTDGVTLWPIYRYPYDLISERAQKTRRSGREDLNRVRAGFLGLGSRARTQYCQNNVSYI